MKDLVTLHRYWIWANRLRDLLDRVLAQRGMPTEESFPVWFADDPGLLMSHWYAALYVVVEGYQELGLHDAGIDQLLASSYVDLLRRYRNGVCHFQRGYFDSRFIDFMGPPGTPAWVRKLNAEFGRFFLEQLRNAGAESAGGPA